jgi:hypothetical protein
MDISLQLLLGGLGIIVGFLSGLLGIGGGIIMTPLLLYTPQLFGFAPLSMRTAAGLTIVQGLVSCIAGVLTHKRNHFVSKPLTIWMGTTIFFTAFAGGAASGKAGDRLLLTIFAGMALLAALLIFIPTKKDSEQPLLADFSFSRAKAVTVAGSVGFMGGLVGQGGSFICVPLMTSFMQVPTRIAIGSNLAIVLLSSAATFIGKAFTGQIAWQLALPIALAVVPTAHLGAMVSKKMPLAWLRLLLACCIALAAVKVGLSAASL